MQSIVADEALWASTILPKGLLVRWFLADGTIATAGQVIAEIRVEDALHEVSAPSSGRLKIFAATNDVIEPGSVLATLSPK